MANESVMGMHKCCPRVNDAVGLQRGQGHSLGTLAERVRIVKQINMSHLTSFFSHHCFASISSNNRNMVDTEACLTVLVPAPAPAPVLILVPVPASTPITVPAAGAAAATSAAAAAAGAQPSS